MAAPDYCCQQTANGLGAQMDETYSGFFSSTEKAIPPTESLQAIADFWDTHSLADYWDQTEPAEFEFDPQGIFSIFRGRTAVAGLMTEPRRARSETGPSCPHIIEKILPRRDAIIWSPLILIYPPVPGVFVTLAHASPEPVSKSQIRKQGTPSQAR